MPAFADDRFPGMALFVFFAAKSGFLRVLSDDEIFMFLSFQRYLLSGVIADER